MSHIKVFLQCVCWGRGGGAVGTHVCSHRSQMLLVWGELSPGQTEVGLSVHVDTLVMWWFLSASSSGLASQL